MADVDLDDVEEAILDHPDPVVKANELSETLGCTSRHVLDLLRLLERSGEVESKKIGARAVAWWHIDRLSDRPTSESRADSERTTNEQQPNSEEITTEQQGNDEISHDVRSSNVRQNHERATSESRTNEGTAKEHPANDEEVASKSRENDEGLVDRVVSDAATQWSDTPERIQKRKSAARAVLEAIRDRPMSKSEVLDQIEPEHSIEGQSPRTWWRANLVEGPAPLKEIASYSNTTKKWEWDPQN